MQIFMVNNRTKVSKMKSAGSQHALKVLIENNLEAVEAFENTKDPGFSLAVSINLKNVSICGL